MEVLKLTQLERRNYEELFQLCDVDGTGKITGIKASELFLSSGLGQEALLQISELCGAKRLGHFGRSQFYIALKLIAAAQLGLPLKLDSLNSGKDMPLPKFSRLPEQENMVASYNSQQDGIQIERVGQAVPLQQHPPAGQLPPPPVTRKTHLRRDSGQQRALVDRDSGGPASVPVQQQQQPTSQTQTREESPLNVISPSNTTSPPPPSSPPIQQQPSQPSIPTVSVSSQGNPQKPTQGTAPHHGSFNSLNSTHDVGWASFEDEESHGLLGTGPKKFNLEPPGIDTSSVSSDPESVDDVWAITDEQKDYYIKQFQTMLPDLNGVIIGGVAKEFFEKSKLPVRELSQIWNLADINKDGALSLEEFCIAMHLVVLRRHDVELPERLPLSLMPYTAFTDEEPFNADLPKGSTLKRATPPQSTSPQSQPQPSQWAQSLIQESPQVPSDVSSPNQPPVQFDFSKPVPSDPEAVIVHPVPMRASPETVKKDGRERVRAFSEPAPLVDTSIPEHSSPGPPEETRNTGPSPIANRPGPVPGTVTGLLIPVPASSQPEVTGLEEPPAPPPRPPQQHSRSLSVDLQGLSAPPAVPPRASPKDSPAVKRGDMSFSATSSEKIHKHAEFKIFEPIPSQEALDTMVPAEVSSRLPQSDGLDTHRRTLSLDHTIMGPNRVVTGAEGGDSSLVLSGSTNTQTISPSVTFDVPEEQEEVPVEKHKLPYRQVSRDKKDLQMAIRTHKERNCMLERLSSELNQELQEVMEQRIALEIQLEHLKPVYS